LDRGVIPTQPLSHCVSLMHVGPICGTHTMWEGVVWKLCECCKGIIIHELWFLHNKIYTTFTQHTHMGWDPYDSPTHMKNDSCTTVVQGLRDMKWVSCGEFHHMGPTWDPSHVSWVVHNSCAPITLLQFYSHKFYFMWVC
jgi:hypothetical protein